jgi:hypothetical protein
MGAELGLRPHRYHYRGLAAQRYPPLKTRGAYPERFYEALHRWQEDEKIGKANVCSTSIQEWLKEHP